MRRIILLGVMLLSMNHAYSSETIQKLFNVSPGQKLSLDLNTGGSIIVTGWDRTQLSVDVQLKGRDWSDVSVDFQQSASGVEITSRFARRRDNQNSNLEFTIKVPRRFELEIDSMGGSIAVSDVEGRINGKTMGGDLHLKNLRGEVNLSTMGGPITLIDSEVDGNLSTMGGTVIFQDVTGGVKGSSMGGNVLYKNVRSAGATGPTRSSRESREVEISTMGGEINVTDAPNGANVSTMGGDVKIGRAGRHAKAKTMGGDITIDAVDGWIQAETMGGNVSATMVGNPAEGKRDVRISSKGGDITLTVPEGLSMQFDIELAFTKNSKLNYRIVSDFQIQTQETQNWDFSHGTARKYVYGTGVVRGGKNRIEIDTINGNVYIKRGR